jgi:DnaJ family protein A protein 5
MATTNIRCHYEVLGVERTADSAAIKKAHRKLALKLHPDKNIGDDSAAEQFRLVQQAYECLSDPTERKWYDEHRDAILKGWSANNNNGNDLDILFDVVPFTYAGCYRGFGDEDGSFFAVYRSVFRKIYEGEVDGVHDDKAQNLDYLNVDFGGPDSPWEDVKLFYQGWEAFSSSLSFAWEDQYDVLEAPNRRVRRAMEDENRKARRTAKKSRNDDVLALVRFVKKRDPRVIAQKQKTDEAKAAKELEQKAAREQKKLEAQAARENWKAEAEENLAAMEEMDRLAGRVRLADLDDDYDYGAGKKGKKKGKKGKKRVVEEGTKNEEKNSVDEAVEEESSSHLAEDNKIASQDEKDSIDESAPLANEVASASEEEISDSESSEELDVWRCECCRKDFKSEGQMENHMKSKKHKEAWKKYEKKLKQQQEANE